MKNKPTPRPGDLPENPSLSVCMIVCDEENNLFRCLKSVQAVADELIVVDTGSTDNTIAIARDFEAKVFPFEWCDDFAAARNVSLEHATGDWIFQIDADEELSKGSIPELKASISEPNILSCFVTCDNGPEYRGPRFGLVCRLYRRRAEVRYTRPYHESVQPSLERLVEKAPSWKMVSRPDIVIYHYGYREAPKMENKWQRGLRIMKAFLNENPGDAYTLTKLGGVCHQLDRDQEAEGYLREALRIEPNWAQTNYHLGLALEGQGKVDEAIEHCRKAIFSDPFLAEAHCLLGQLYISKGDINDAISVLDKALSLNPELESSRRLLAEAYALQGGIYVQQGLLAEAIRIVKEALDIDPEHASAHNNLGLAYVNQGEYGNGVAELKKAISIDPELPNAHLNLGMAYAKLEMLDQALQEFEHALKLDPEYATAHYNLAILHYKKDNFKKAIEHCDKAADLGANVNPQLLELLKPLRQSYQ